MAMSQIGTRQRRKTGVSMTDEMDLNAQSRFFPAWWMHIGTDVDSAPHYRVICKSEAELALARAVEPDIVHAEYVLRYSSERISTSRY